MHDHYILKCSCGNIVSQCRCMAADKTIKVVDNGCQQCKAKIENPEVLGSAVSPGCMAEIEAIKELCKELLIGADKCGQEPHYIVQPFLGIVQRHAATINKHGLI